MMKRVSILITLCALVSSAADRSSFAKATARRPNVVMIVCDDLNDFVTGMGGHPQARTPNIAKLAASGVAFKRAYSNSPVCNPSRASFFTGIYPQNSGHYFKGAWYQNPVLKNSKTIMEHFRGNGYRAVGSGKMMHAHLRTCWDEYPYKPDYGPYAYDGKKKVAHPSVPSPFNTNGPIDGSFAPLSDVPFAEDKSGKKGWVYGGWGKRPVHMKYNSETDRDPTPDERNAQWAADRIKKFARDGRKQPFFLGVGFIRPHTPLHVPKKFFDMFPLDDIRIPAILEGDAKDCRYKLKAGRETLGEKQFRLLVESYPNKTAALKAYTQAYLACVAAVDECVGQVVDAVDNSPFKDNTIIVLTSDHGFHLGEKDHLWKYTLWEESGRVPLIFRAPGVTKPGGLAEHPVSLIDIYPTLIELCKLQGDTRKNDHGAKLDGHSMVPFLKDPKATEWTGRSAALTVVYNWVNQDAKKQHYSIRSKDFRYIRYWPKGEELYDHRNDPNEWKNVVDNPEYAEIKKRLGKILDGILAEAPKAPPKKSVTQEEKTAAEKWKDTYFKKHPDADTNKDGTLTWPEYKKHKNKN